MAILSFSVFFSIVAGSAVFWLAYRLLAYNRPAHGIARAFLLLGLTAPIVISVIQQYLPAAAGTYTLSYRLPEVIVGHSAGPAEGTRVINGLAISYGLVVAMLLLQNLLGVARLLRRLKASPVRGQKGIRIYGSTGYGPGSMGRIIFFPRAEIDARILMHETGHVRLGHRYDLALANLICALFWINPFCWVLRRELRLVHEFQADAFTLKSAVASDSYAKLLLQQTLRVPGPALSHAFFHHPIKQRIAMLCVNKPSRKDQVRRNLSLSLTTVIVLAAALFVRCKPGPTPEPLSVTFEQPEGSQLPSDVLTTADNMPEFNGDLSGYMVSEIKYPEAARNTNIEGRAVIRFVVTDAGKITGAEIVRSSGSELLDAEALRAVKAMPDWKPGRDNGKPVSVYFTMPVTFRLDDAPADATPGVSAVFKAADCSYQEYITFRSDALHCGTPAE